MVTRWGPSDTGERKTHCPRGHEYTGRNVLPRKNAAHIRGCRACCTAHMWAKRHNMFNDNPVVLARADALAAKYVTEEP